MLDGPVAFGALLDQVEILERLHVRVPDLLVGCSAKALDQDAHQAGAVLPAFAEQEVRSVVVDYGREHVSGLLGIGEHVRRAHVHGRVAALVDELLPIGAVEPFGRALKVGFGVRKHDHMRDPMLFGELVDIPGLAGDVFIHEYRIRAVHASGRQVPSGELVEVCVVFHVGELVDVRLHVLERRHVAVSFAFAIVSDRYLVSYFCGYRRAAEHADHCAVAAFRDEYREVRCATEVLYELDALQPVVAHLDGKVVAVAEALLEHVIGGEAEQEVHV